MKKINAITGYALRMPLASGTGAGLGFRASVLAAVAMALMPQTMRAQTPLPVVPKTFMILDDFTKGPQTINIASGNQTNSYTDPLNDGHIVGGTRAFELTIGAAGNNPYGQPVQVEVLPNPGSVFPAFVWSVGYGVIGPRIDLGYGFEGPSKSPLNLRLGGYDRIRVMFGGLVGNAGFDLVAFQGSNLEAGSCSVAVEAFPGPFAVDFPLNAFVLGSGGVDFSDIAAFDFILQNQGLGFGADLAITGIYAIPKGVVTDGTQGTPDGQALYTCAKPS